MPEAAPGISLRDVPPWLWRAPEVCAAAAAALAMAGLAAWLGGLTGPVSVTPRLLQLPLPEFSVVALLVAAAIAARRLAAWRRAAAALAAGTGVVAFSELFSHRHGLENVLLGGWAGHLHAALPLPMAGALSLGLTALGLAVLLHQALPRTAMGLTIGVLFLGLLEVLPRLFATPAPAHAAPGSQVSLMAALCLTLLAAGWMIALPDQRPMAYFLENSSAGWMLRRLLPLTLLFPLASTWSSWQQRHSSRFLAEIASLVTLATLVAFWVALMWLVARALDRADATHARAELEMERHMREEMEAHQQLSATESKVRLLLDSTGEGIYYTNLNGKCVWCNTAAARLLGYAQPRDLLGHNMHDLIHHTRADGSPYPETECRFRLSALRGVTDAEDEELLWRADGSSFPADVHAYPVLEQGRPVGVVATFADASRRVALDRQFRQSQKMEAIGRLASGIAHDFNNLLTVINGYADLLLDRELPQPVHDNLDSIRKAGEKAAALTHQLLAFSRQQTIQPQVLNLNQVLSEMDRLLTRVIGEDVELQTILDPEAAPVKADPGQLEQVLMNLAVNARDAMPRGGKLTIETCNTVLDGTYAATHPGVVPGRYTMMAVTDTGHGMDAATLAKAFEPFFTTKPVGKGTGLGLASVFGIIKQHGGHIAVYSEVGHGTSMKVYLPTVADARTALPVLGPERALHGEETILLIEDDDSVSELIEQLLTTSGYRVLRASEPEAAIRLAGETGGPIDLLMSDLVLPRMSGREVVKQIQQIRPGLRVLFTSGYADGAVARQENHMASSAFLQKPFSQAALLAKVRQVLDQDQTPAHAVCA